MSHKEIIFHQSLTRRDVSHRCDGLARRLLEWPEIPLVDVIASEKWQLLGAFFFKAWPDDLNAHVVARRTMPGLKVLEDPDRLSGALPVSYINKRYGLTPRPLDGRHFRLPSHHHVDHIDGDKLNDDLGNLQVLTSSDHAKKTAAEKGRRVVDFTCPSCGVRATKDRRQTHLGDRSRRYMTCSSSCGAKMGHRLKRGYTSLPEVLQSLDCVERRQHDEVEIFPVYQVSTGFEITSPIFQVGNVQSFDIELNSQSGDDIRRFCLVCQSPCSSGLTYCSPACRAVGRRRVARPSKEQLGRELGTLSWVALGRKYGVSDNAVRKWAKRYGLR